MNNEIKNYASYYLRHNKKLLILIYTIIFVFLPFLILNQGDYLDSSNALNNIILIYFFAGGLLAFLIPLLNYRFMYEKRSCDLYFSLPIKKGKLFDIQYILGLVIVFGPLLSNVVLTLLIMFFKRIPIDVLPLFVTLIGLSFFIIVQYTIFVFFIQKCNNRLDAVFINLSYLILPAVLIGTLMTFYGSQVSNIFVSHVGLNASFFQVFPQDLISLLSVPYTAVVYIIEIINDLFRTNENVAFSFFSWWMILYWAVVMGVCYYFGRKSFIQRREEYAENRSTSLFTYPFVIIAITFSLLLMVDVSFNIIPLIIIFIIYIGMLFFANRKIKLSIKNLLIFCLMYASVFGFSFIFDATNGFGLMQEVFNINEVSSVEIGYYLPSRRAYTINNEAENYVGLSITFDEADDLEDVLELQEAFVKQVDSQDFTKEFIEVRFDYVLKDGSEHTRAYFSQTTKVDEMINDRLNNIVGDEETLNNLVKENKLEMWNRD